MVLIYVSGILLEVKYATSRYDSPQVRPSMQFVFLVSSSDVSDSGEDSEPRG